MAGSKHERKFITIYWVAQELGTTIFDAENGVMTLHFDKPTLRKLWDNYYVPYIKGWCR